MRKLTALFAVVTALVALSSSAWACWVGKKDLVLQQETLVGARMYCLYEAIHAPAVADRLRFEELADMIGEGQVTYADSYDPKLWVHAGKVWHLYLAALELEQKLELEKKTTDDKTKRLAQIRKEAKDWMAKKKKKK